MTSKLKLTNRYDGRERKVSLEVWDLMRKDGRSKYWTPEPLNTPTKKTSKKSPEKEEIKIERITSTSNINETNETDGTN